MSDLMLDIARDLVVTNEELAGELAVHSIAVRHDLIVLAGGACECDDGTCPGLITR